LFLGLSWWWLSEDHSIPIFDAGLHLTSAMEVYERLRSGHVGAALTLTYPYPPFAFLVGVLGLWVGGLGVAQAIFAQDLVFVPLLALGCYGAGRLAFGSRAGLLAVVVALGSPLIVAQFHVFMIDAPEAAMVALAVWLVLASDGFSRVGPSVAAGVAVGLGLLTKEPFAFFVAGVLVAALVRAGLRASRGEWRALWGLVAFSLIALAIALPWYVHYFTQVRELARSTTISGNRETYTGVAPPSFSAQNLTWYLWNITNAQLYVPLFVFALVGGTWTVVGLARRRPIGRFTWDLLAGAFIGWMGITFTFVHDVRYSIPLLIYLAVFAGCWIGRLPRIARLSATGALVVLTVANTLAVNFGVGRPVRISLPGSKASEMQNPGILTLYSNGGFPVGRPSRDGDVLALMRTLRHHGVRAVGWINLDSGEPPPALTPIFSKAGLKTFAAIAGLKVIPTEAWEQEPSERRTFGAGDALLGHGQVRTHEPPPCVKLSDGSGVWVRLGNPNASGAKDYCPYRHPALYG
jgi:4-amino-4-deoxy-L-arabinose transferase-like glycosyltransferase